MTLIRRFCGGSGVSRHRAVVVFAVASETTPFAATMPIPNNPYLCQTQTPPPSRVDERSDRQRLGI